MLEFPIKTYLYITIYHMCRFTPDQGFGAGLSLAPFASSQSDHYTDETTKVCVYFTYNGWLFNYKCFSFQSTSLNLDTERPSNSGLDDLNRGNVDGK